jgi:hypothetical protein
MKKTRNNKSGLGRSALKLRKSKNAFLTLALLLILTTGLQASLSDGLVAYYPFNGNANDESGNGNHGVPGKKGEALLPTTCEDRCGDLDSAYCFVDNGRDHGNWINVTSLQTAYFPRYTISCWFKINSLKRPSILISKGRSGGHVATNFQIYIHPDGYIVGEHEIDGTQGVQVYSVVTVELGQWYHVALMYDSSDLKLYVDGELDAINEEPGDPADIGRWPVNIGANGEHDGFFDGAIDEVRIYDRALSECEIKELATACEPVSCGKLLVRSHNGSDWDLHLIGEDGSHLQAIDTTSANIEFRGADFSPDGKNIIYVRSNGAIYEIMQVPVSGGSTSLLLSSTGLPYALLAARWGSPPDHFFYTIQTGGSCGNRDWVTRRRALDGSSDEIIISAISEKDIYLCDIREDLNRSVYGQNIPAGCWSPYGALVTYDADGTNRQVLSVTVDGKCDSSAALSPDGEYVLYGKSDSTSGWQLPNNIYLTTYIDSGTQTRLTSYTGNICAHAPVWRDDDSFFYTLGEQSDGELHYYTISTGEDVVVPCDLPNCQPLDFMIIPEAPTIPATIEIIPNTLNLKSKGKWITCYIWLPEGYYVSDISNILLEDNIEPRQMWSDEKKQIMKTRFSREEIQDILKIGRVNLTVSGLLSDGTVFEGTDIIIVIDKGSRN